ncbi:hypothetical protein [Bradyrhizobium genosp. P]|uniref:hypothetical protein n=1 Tax=Bradyrhizobium genosp. P TaxID=83641 RepID=UPI003CF3D4F8
MTSVSFRRLSRVAFPSDERCGSSRMAPFSEQVDAVASRLWMDHLEKRLATHPFAKFLRIVLPPLTSVKVSTTFSN